MKTTRKISIALVVVMLLMMTLAIIPASATETRTIYLDAGGSSLWDQANAWFEAGTWGSAQGNAWATFTDTDGDGIYEAEVYADVTGMKIYRRGPGVASGNWDGDYWNYSGELSVPSDKNMYTITGWNVGDGTWSTYVPTECAKDYNVNGKCSTDGCTICHYYTVTGNSADVFGSSWDPATGKKMSFDSETGAYTLVCENVPVSESAYEFKCIQDGNSSWTPGYPAQNATFKVTLEGSKVIITLDKDKNVTVSVEAPHEHDYSIPATCEKGESCECGAVKEGSEPVEHGTDACTCTIVKVDNTEKWNTVYCYYADKDWNAGKSWPGDEMTLGEDGLWSYLIPAGNYYVIFHNNEGTQTDNLLIPATDDDKIICNNSEGTWSAPHVHDYKNPATCSKAPYCDCGAEDPNGEALGHSENCGCTLVKLYNAAGWTNVYCHSFIKEEDTATDITKWPGAEMEYSEDGTYYFLYLPAEATHVVYNNGEGVQTSDIAIADAKEYNNFVVKLTGSFNDWNETAMTAKDGTAIITLELAAGTYEFKVVLNGIWLGNNGEIADTTITADYNGGWEFLNKDAEGNDLGNCKLIAKGGKYTFTFYAATNKLNVEWECIHNVDETSTYTVTTLPTAEANGEAVVKCATCDADLTMALPALSPLYLRHYMIQVGDCSTDKDVYTIALTDLNEKIEGCVNISFNVDIDYAHSVTETSEYNIITLPTAEANGSLTAKCTVCTKELTLAIPALNPIYVERGIYQIQYGTCKTNKDGYSILLTDLEEKVDGAIYVTFDIAHEYEHTEVEDAAVAATCTENGKSAGSHCSVCDEVLVAQTVIPAPGHALGDWVVSTPATETETGIRYRQCSNCTHKVIEEIPELTHDHSRWEEIILPAKAATCTATGLTEGKKCSGCNATLVDQETIPALPHTEVIDPAVAATCTTAGKTEGKHCSVCNEVLVAQKAVAALGHTEVVDAPIDATCTESGLTTGKHCSVCNEVLVAQEPVAALGHDMTTDAAVAPTCTETGLTEGSHCVRCDHKVAQEVVAALGHTEVVDAAVAATCTKKGLTEGKHCSVCNVVTVAQETVEALGHTEVVDAAVESTCTKTGLTEGKHCSVCNEVLVAQKTVSIKPHSYAEGKCSVCGATDPDYVAPHEHNFVEGECECGAKDPNYVAPTPDPEPGFFESIWQAILNFFKSIGDFFVNLFSGGKE